MDKPTWNSGHPDIDGYYLVWNKTLKRREILRWDHKQRKWFIGNFVVKGACGWHIIPDEPKNIVND